MAPRRDSAEQDGSDDEVEIVVDLPQRAPKALPQPQPTALFKIVVTPHFGYAGGHAKLKGGVQH